MIGIHLAENSSCKKFLYSQTAFRWEILANYPPPPTQPLFSQVFEIVVFKDKNDDWV